MSETKRVPTRYRRARQPKPEAATATTTTTATRTTSSKEEAATTTAPRSNKLSLTVDTQVNNKSETSLLSPSSGYATPGAWSFASSSGVQQEQNQHHYQQQQQHQQHDHNNQHRGREGTTECPLSSSSSNFYYNANSSTGKLSNGSRESETSFEEQPQRVERHKSSKSIRSRTSKRNLRQDKQEKQEKEKETVPPVPASLPDNLVSITVKLPTQFITKSVRENTKFGDLLQELVSEHRYELEHSDVDEYMLWEVCAHKYIQRPIRPDEFVKFVHHSWEQGSAANFVRIGSSTRRLDTASTASLVPRRDMLNKEHGPGFSGKVHYWRNQSDWRKGWVDISQGVLTLRKRENGKELRTLMVGDFELYEYYNEMGSQQPMSTPGAYSFAIRSQQSPTYFMDKHDAIHYFSTDSSGDYDQLRNIIYSLRSQAVTKQCASYQQLLDDPTCFSPVNAEPMLQVKDGNDVPLARLHIDNNNSSSSSNANSSNNGIKQDGLLGAGYQKKQQQALANHSAATSPMSSSQPFAPNSLLSKPTSLLAQQQQQHQHQPKVFETGRGLMAHAYGNGNGNGKQQRAKDETSPVTSTGPLPQHSMAVQHRLHR